MYLPTVYVYQKQRLLVWVRTKPSPYAWTVNYAFLCHASILKKTIFYSNFLNQLLLSHPQWCISLQQVWKPIEYALKFWWIVLYALCSFELFCKRSKEQRYWIVRVYSNKYCSRRVLSKAWAHCQNHCCFMINIWWSILMHERIHLTLLWRGRVYSRSGG